MFSLTNRHRVLPYLLAAAWGWACTDTPGASPANESVHADSAGIEIVVNAVGADGASAFATLDATPSLRLGAPEGRPEEQFGRVSDVVPMPDGGVAVLDAQAAEIRMFDADGAYRSTLGGRGQGPGEFQRPIALAWLARDTLAVFDAGPNRITRFGAGGEPVRTTTLEGTGPRITAAAFLHDGRLIGQSHWLNPDGGALPGPDLTFVRDTVVLTLFAAAGTVEDTVDVLPGLETLTGIQITERSVSVFKFPAAFGHTNVFAPHPDGVWSSANDRFELRLLSPDGHLMRIVRAPGLERPVTDAVARAVRDRIFADADTPEARRQAEEWYGGSPRPETQPAFDAIVVDDRARLWVREWSPAGPATRWWVFAPQGDLLGVVEVPHGTRITAARCGSVWGIEEDEFDVSYAVRYAVRGADNC